MDPSAQGYKVEIYLVLYFNDFFQVFAVFLCDLPPLLCCVEGYPCICMIRCYTTGWDLWNKHGLSQ